jgi:hypothetical protein
MAVGFGISLGYHRLHTHRGYKTSKPFEYFLAVCGTLTLEGGPIFWVATHRIHHQHSDQEGDPHTPHDGGFWAHMGWILFGDMHHNNTVTMAKYAPDLAADPFYRWLNTYHYVPLVLLGLILLAVGGRGLAQQSSCAPRFSPARPDVVRVRPQLAHAEGASGRGRCEGVEGRQGTGTGARKGCLDPPIPGEGTFPFSPLPASLFPSPSRLPPSCILSS